MKKEKLPEQLGSINSERIYTTLEPRGPIYYHGCGININYVFFHKTAGLQGFFWGEQSGSFYEKHAASGSGVEMKQFIDSDGKISYTINE